MTIDAAFMRKTFNIHTDVVNDRITPYFAPASRRLKKWVGVDLYQTPGDYAEELKLAEGNLVMHFMQINLNTHIRSKGLVATETVEGNVTVRYLNPDETMKMSTFFLEQAQQIVSEFDIYDDIPPSPEIIADDKSISWLTQK